MHDVEPFLLSYIHLGLGRYATTSLASQATLRSSAPCNLLVFASSFLTRLLPTISVSFHGTSWMGGFVLEGEEETGVRSTSRHDKHTGVGGCRCSQVCFLLCAAAADVEGDMFRLVGGDGTCSRRANATISGRQRRTIRAW